MKTKAVAGLQGRKRWKRVAAVAIGALLVLLSAGAVFVARPAAPPPAGIGGDARVPIGLLGDSDNHGYHDDVLLPAPMRGGTFRATSLQWTELLARLRGGEVDFGPWGVWGTRGSVSKLQDLLGIASRAPRKQDHYYNFAVSGVGCDVLADGAWRQAQRLLDAMRSDPARWARGAIVIRVGINSLGSPADQDTWARTGLDGAARAKVALCAGAIERTIALIRAEHAQTAIVVVTNCDDNLEGKEVQRWSASIQRIREIYDAYDGAVREIVGRTPRTALFVDRAWVRRTWGPAPGTSDPYAYRSVSLGGSASVTWSRGDPPSHALLADGHFGTVANGLWANELLALLRERFGIAITPLTPLEIAHAADPAGSFGIAPR